MPMNPKRVRTFFAAGIVLMLALVIGFYSYARYRVRRALVEVPAKLGVNIQQSTEGFTFSKSEGGRTLFSLSAGKAVQYKQGQRATLSNVRIVVYGRNEAKGKSGTAAQPANDHYDQILGKEFDYDPASGDVTANGEVQIDLDAEGKPAATLTQAQNEAQPVGTIHLRTSALTFNQKTGIAETDQRVDFALPQASGSAVGAKYDSKLMALILQKDVKLNSKPSKSGSGGGMEAATITADSAVIADQPRRALLTSARGEQRNHKFSADTVTFSLRGDGTISDLQASGNVRSVSTGASTTELRASAAEFTFGANNEIAHLELNGQVGLHQTGASQMEGSAGHAAVTFGAKNQLQKVRATNDVHFSQGGNAGARGSQEPTGQGMKLAADGVDLYFAAGNKLQRAETSGNAQLETDSLASAAPVAGSANAAANAGQAKKPSHTIITAGKFDATFGPQNRMKSLFASPEAKIVSATPGQPDAVSTSRDLTATFDPAHRGALVGISQRGDFHFSDSQRTASAELADYSPADDTITLSGSPRIQDIGGGLSVSADHIKMNRISQAIAADGNVKSSYQTGKGKNSAGALLSSPSGDPAHVTGDAMTFAKTSGVARFTGHARLWQGADIIQAPVITLDRKNNSLLASGAEGAAANVGAPQPVTVSFAKADKAGKIQPVTVVGARLTYTDADRVAKWDGPVEMKMADATMSAKRLDVFLQSKRSSGAAANAPSQIDHAVANGDVVIEQKKPPRKATGETLVYTAAEDKFVLTGSSGKPPSIFDAEHGNVTGNSLTFYNRDDRVQIGGSESSRTVTRTAIKSESKP